jgi:hypothetical protein
MARPALPAWRCIEEVTMADNTIPAEIDPARLAQVVRLDQGAHTTPEEGMCVMEAVAFVRGLPFSDHPPCVCPVIGAFMRAWNDGLPDDERNALLLPLIPRLINTKGSKALEERRALMAADWLVRVHTPAWLRLAGLIAQADALASLPEITSMAQVPSIRGPLEAVRKDAAAAWAAAWDAARAAAWAAARDAARDAAGDAARDAAWDAARAAAWDAAWDAARDAAWDAANKKLAPVKEELQQSALGLVERMIAVSEERECA